MAFENGSAHFDSIEEISEAFGKRMSRLEGKVKRRKISVHDFDTKASRCEKTFVVYLRKFICS